MRITGLATGLDMDEIVKNSMKPYRIKIDKKGQEKEILEIKQKLYREVIKDSREFYNKYFDITKNDSLINSKNWSTAKFTYDDKLVSVTSTGGVGADNFTVSGKIAKANQLIIEKGIEKGNEIIINGEKFTLKGENPKDIASNLNNELKEKGINVSVKYTQFAGNVNDGNIGPNVSGFIFESTILGRDNNFTIEGNFTNIKGSVVEGTDTTFTTNTIKVDDIKGQKITINGNLIDLTGKSTGEDITSYINDVLKNNGINASFESGNIVLTSNVAGSSQSIVVNKVEVGAGGEDAEIIIKNSKGGVFTHKGNSNNATIDGIEFSFKGDIDNEITIRGNKNVDDLKNNLVNFFNDYNKLVEKLNTLTLEKRDKNFMPLTSDQKKEMSEDEIKLWNEKVQKGQLSRDTDLTRINNSLKEAMRTMVDGTNGLNLEKIGISPVKDYSGSKNGTFTIDENKLVKALEDNSEQIMNMFVKVSPNDETISNTDKYSKTGILSRVKDILNTETLKSTSTLLKKVGYEGAASAYNNEISLSIKKYEEKMKDMEKDFTTRQQALYSKYATLETMMNKYNSQQSYLTQQLGLG